jgi:cytochrome c peroxidase
MRGRGSVILALALFGIAGYALAGGLELDPMEELGKSVFFDDNLSLERNQACAACHAPEVGFTGPIEVINAHGSVYEGSVATRFGDRKPPAASYAFQSPVLHYEIEKKEPVFVGGNFWNGRATGDKLGNPAADQAQGPFLNPVEQGLPDNACVVYRVCNPAVPADYPVMYEDVWPGGCDILWPIGTDAMCEVEGTTIALSVGDLEKVETAYDNIALAIAAYEGSAEVSSYTSKFDYVMAGLAEFTKDEKKGFAIFRGKGKCRLCHVLDAGPDGPPLFTDYTFDNLGVPKNPENPVYNVNPGFIDTGLGGFLETQGEVWADLAEENMGKQKVPTLRNVAKAPSEAFQKAFGHNGYFKSLLGIVHFYNTRDVKETCPDPLTTEADALAMNCWPAPEVAENVNDSELGDLHMNPRQEELLVEFLKTLSDGWTPEE